MEVTCHACTEGVTSAGNSCEVCGGDGNIDLNDIAFRSIKRGPERSLKGLVWSAILDKLDSLLAEQVSQGATLVVLEEKLNDNYDKVEDVLDKCNDIFEQVSE